MKIASILSEGRNRPIIFDLNKNWGGGKIKIDIDMWHNGYLGKFSLVYVGQGCGKNMTRIIGIDSAHPGHFKDTPHYHFCSHRKSLNNDLSMSQIINLFVTFVSKFIMKNHNKNVSLTLEEQKLLNEMPEFNDFINEVNSHLLEWDKALERNREYYRRNPTASPITKDTPSLDNSD